MNIYLDSVGCRLNQAEIEAFASQFRAAGHQVVADASKADLVVVNTCAVTKEAASDSRQKVRQAARAGASQVVVTGCWASLDPRGAAALPGVKRVVPNLEKDFLVPELLGRQGPLYEREPLAREPLPGAHRRTRAFIKVQDGCNNHCTFCVTTIARGPGRSRPAADVLADVRAALVGGAQEVVLTGVHLGSWGHDLTPRLRLEHLIRTLLAETDIPRLRLSSLEPWDLDESFFSLWQDTRLCRHLHLPLQSGSGTILRRMARKTTPESFARLVEQARAVIPDVAITTDVIVGFPGEGEAEFRESMEYVRELGFAGGHVFTYSERPGTAAARFPNQVPPEERKERNARMRAVLAQAARSYQARFLGAELEVLWEATDAYGPEGWRLRGLSDNYLRVSAYASQPLWNQICRVRIERLAPDGLAGRLLP
jgi:threonylcarbamoyladenosine tRNA methylthiotransferase MtaB